MLENVKCVSDLFVLRVILLLLIDKAVCFIYSLKVNQRMFQPYIFVTKSLGHHRFDN